MKQPLRIFRSIALSVSLCLAAVAVLRAGPASAEVLTTAQWQAQMEKARGLLSEGRKTEAARETRSALKGAERRFGPEDTRVADALDLLGEITMAQGRRARALPLFERALVIRQEALGPSDSIVAKKMIVLARFYMEAGLVDAAAGLMEQALVVQEQAGGGQRVVADTLIILADIYLTAGKPNPAKRLADRALTIRHETLPPRDPLVLDTLILASKIHLTAGDPAGAEVFYREAVAIQQGDPGKPDPRVTELEDLISKNPPPRESKPKRVTDQALLEESRGTAVPDIEMEPGGAGLSVAKSLHHRGQAFVSLGRHSQAEELYRQALELYEKVLGIADSRTQELIDDYAKLLVKMGQPIQARKLRERAAHPATTEEM